MASSSRFSSSSVGQSEQSEQSGQEEELLTEPEDPRHHVSGRGLRANRATVAGTALFGDASDFRSAPSGVSTNNNDSSHGSSGTSTWGHKRYSYYKTAALPPLLAASEEVQQIDGYETAPFFSVLDEVRKRRSTATKPGGGEEQPLLGLNEGGEDGDSGGVGGSPAVRNLFCRLLPLLLVGGLYFVASTGSIALVKLLNYELDFSFALFFAVLQKSGWIVNIAILFFFGCTRRSSFTWPSWRDFLKYSAVGFFSALSDALDMYGLVRLQGSTYALLRTADLCFNMLLSKLILRKRFTLFHYGAVLVVIAGVVVTALSHTAAADWIGVALVLGGCLGEAANTVLSDKIMTKSAAQSGDKLRYLFEYTLWVSLAATFFLMVPLLLSREYAEWPAGVAKAAAAGWIGNWKQPLGYAFLLVCVGIALCRLFVRLSKYWIVEKRSAFTFSILKPVRRVFSVLFLVLLWPQNEPLTWFKIGGMVLTLAGFSLYIFGSRRVSMQQRKALVSLP